MSSLTKAKEEKSKGIAQKLILFMEYYTVKVIYSPFIVCVPILLSSLKCFQSLAVKFNKELSFSYICMFWLSFSSQTFQL